MCVYIYTHIYLLCTLFSHFLSLLLILFLAIFVLIVYVSILTMIFSCSVGQPLSFLSDFFPLFFRRHSDLVLFYVVQVIWLVLLLILYFSQLSLLFVLFTCDLILISYHLSVFLFYSSV